MRTDQKVKPSDDQCGDHDEYAKNFSKLSGERMIEHVRMFEDSLVYISTLGNRILLLSCVYLFDSRICLLTSVV